MAQLPDPPVAKVPLEKMPDWRRQWFRLLFWELVVLVCLFAGGVIYFALAVKYRDGSPFSYAGMFIINGAILGAIFHRLRHIREDLRTYRG